MERADEFLVIGEKVQELEEAGYNCFVFYYGNVFNLVILVMENPLSEDPGMLIKLSLCDFDAFGDFLEEFQKRANCLIYGR